MKPQNNHDINIELSKSIRTILNNNGIKPKSLLARSVECSFLQGYLYALPEQISANPMLFICLSSGRSLLNEYPVLN